MKLKKLGRKKAHKIAMLKNMARSIFTYYGIITTLQKAKEVRKLVDKLITLAKENTIASKRNAYSYLQNHKLVKKLFDEIAPKFADRKGGYTKITRLSVRKGDGASMVLIELIGFEEDRRKRIEELEERRKKRKEEKMTGPA